MSDTPQIFTDGIANISLQNGIVRVDHFTLQPGDTENSEKKISHRMVMSTESFLQNFSSMERVINQLMERGIISRREPAEDTETVSDQIVK